MSGEKINSICAITESSNTDFPKTKLAITTFIHENKWFIGRIIGLTETSNPLTSHNINVLGQLYNDIEIREVDDIDSPKLSDNDRLDYLRIHAFNIQSEGNIYFSRNCVFLKDISDTLNNENISSFEIGNTNPLQISFEFSKIDSGFMFIPSICISEDKVDTLMYDDIDSAINSYISDHNYVIQKNIIIMKSSLYPDNKYSEFIRYHKHTNILIMNSFGGSSYTRIILYWISLNKKFNDIKPSKVRIAPGIKVIPNLKVDETKYKISVIIPAYKADRYIVECINSIKNQRTGATIEILIGVDNCPSTLAKLRDVKKLYNNIRIFNSSTSSGPYIIRNSLLRFANYDNILFFDADDVMKPNMISTILSYYSEQNPIRFKYLNFRDEHGPSINSPHHDIAHGVFFAHKSIINRLGGFMPWMCGADTEFMKRCSINGIREIKLTDYVFYRRIHGNSLTQHVSTNHRSKIRDVARAYIKNNKDWSIPINTKTIELTEI